MCSMRRLFVFGNVPKDVAAQIWRTQETRDDGLRNGTPFLGLRRCMYVYCGHVDTRRRVMMQAVAPFFCAQNDATAALLCGRDGCK